MADNNEITLKKPSLMLVRGLPGTGKTGLAYNINVGGERILEADQYFYAASGRYSFDVAKLEEAHAECMAGADKAMRESRFWGTEHHSEFFPGTLASESADKGHIIVSNTFSCRWEMDPYLCMAKEYGVQVYVIDLFDGGCTDEELCYERCKHGVPIEAIQRMRNRWEHDWRNGDPRPPWERQ